MVCYIWADPSTAPRMERRRRKVLRNEFKCFPRDNSTFIAGHMCPPSNCKPRPNWCIAPDPSAWRPKLLKPRAPQNRPSLAPPSRWHSRHARTSPRICTVVIRVDSRAFNSLQALCLNNPLKVKCTAYICYVNSNVRPKAKNAPLINSRRKN